MRYLLTGEAGINDGVTFPFVFLAILWSRADGAFFYLAFAMYEGNFTETTELYAIVSYMVLFSIVLHGLSGPRVVDYFKRNDPG